MARIIYAVLCLAACGVATSAAAVVSIVFVGLVSGHAISADLGLLTAVSSVTLWPASHLAVETGARAMGFAK